MGKNALENASREQKETPQNQRWSKYRSIEENQMMKKSTMDQIIFQLFKN
jgi:hypothetical protein